MDSEAFRELLTRLGANKVYTVEQDLNCTLFLVTFSGRGFLVSFSRGVHSLYAKVLPADSLLASHWRCSYVQLSPLGLYAFSETVEGLARGVASKLRLLARWEERGPEGQGASSQGG